MENKQQEIRILPAAKAYVRGGKWADKNWRVINAEIGIDTNNAEPLELKNSPGDFDRQIFMSFDISAFKGAEFKHVLLLPSFSKVDSWAICEFALYEVDPAAWNEDTLTFNTKPAFGKVISEKNVAGGLSKIDMTESVREALAAGKDMISFAIVVTSGDSKDYSRINPKTTRLVSTNTDVVQGYATDLREDAAENKAIWDWANTLYDEWYERYQKLLKTGLAKVKKIESDPKHFDKEVFTAKSGFAPATGWTPELVKKYSFPTRTYKSMDDLGKYTDYNKEQKFDEFGGLMDDSRRQEVRGFFYSKKIDGRWWIIDPLGYPCFMRNISSVATCYLGSPNQTNAAIVRYGSKEAWAEKTADLLKNEWGFNLCGTFADETANRSVVQDRCGGMAGGYGSRVGSNCSNGGSTRFSENNTMNVFDPGFVDYCDEKAVEVEAKKDNPWILGYTTDNELPMDRNMLYNYLTLDFTKEVNHYSYACAWTWLTRILGKDNPQQADITPEHVELFRGFVWDRYYNVVCAAVRRHDPNHMLLGTRFLTHVKGAEWVLRFASLYLDCMTINWYGQWQPDADDLKILCERADLPIQVTEFYTKAMDSGLANTRGAGWVVPTQQDRADFYQNFTLRVLECKNFVGWHWHQYLDDDASPEVIYKPGTQIWRDQSNIDANKGIVDSGHRPYKELVEGMAEINKNVYRLIEHFDAKYAD